MEQHQINVDERCHERLKHISKVTNQSMSKLIENWVEELMSLAVECDRAYYKIESSILGNEVRCVLIPIGPSKLQHGTCKSEQELQDLTRRKIVSDLEKKAVGMDI